MLNRVNRRVNAINPAALVETVKYIFKPMFMATGLSIVKPEFDVEVLFGKMQP